MFSKEELDQLRVETPGTSERIHLNNAGAGLMPQIIIDTIKEYLDLEGKIGGYEAHAQEAEAIQGFYNSTAQLLNTQARNIAYTSNATDSYSRALSSISFRQGDVILTTRQDYASNQIAFLQLQKKFGIKIIRAENASSGEVDLNSIDQLMKMHQPKLVAVTQIPTNSGLIQPVEAIGEICKAEDTLYLVDACQSAGQLVLDVQKMHCDFLSVTMRKFMRGPRGAGYLYISDKALAGNFESIFVDLRGATWLEADEYKLKETAQRFELWEKSYALLLGSKVANEYAMKIGMERIEKRVQQLAAQTRGAIQNTGKFRILDQGSRLGGIITFTSPHFNAEQVKKQLDTNKINSSIAPLEAAIIDFTDKKAAWAIRISPHYYNTEEEIQSLIDCLNDLN